MTNLSGVKKYLSLNDLVWDLKFDLKTLKQISEDTEKYYWENPKIDKKGKKRIFHCTKGNLNIIQNRLHKILSKFEFPEYMFGVVAGKSIIDNAEIHIGSKTLVTIDIKDCFPNTTADKVFFTLRHQLSFGQKVAEIVTKLVVYKGEIPQGTHSSSVIVALCLLPMCQEIEKLCQINDLKLSVWVDDIAISGEGTEKVINEIVKVLSKYHYFCRHRKIKVWRKGRIKELTGVAIKNNKITAPKKIIKECNQMIIDIKKGNISTSKIDSIKGKINHIKRLDPKKSIKILTFAKKLGVNLSKT